ncbi:hypothetical protein DAPPUDRAFT_275064 [Daphnia pulex]|uniref:Uncharacterized protein n=1 Tax=Daphnia pulex TaxID=6669 RepID=E9I535_DAPPU|nr:hypothetical protein DAPPUDRAFT_275064 [Daphnia pulex]|eukprot:EFX60895.1 hypothetical protein DAPPUDRAFT_275064 [Daphnia pulex]
MHMDYRSHYGDNYIGGYEAVQSVWCWLTPSRVNARLFSRSSVGSLLLELSPSGSPVAGCHILSVMFLYLPASC